MTKPKAEAIALFSSNGDVACYLPPPILEVNGREQKMTVVSTADLCAEYETDGMKAHDVITHVGDGLYTLDRTLTNVGRGTRTFKLVSELVTAFIPTKYNIPCVSYGGNARFGGREYKGTELDGETWIYAYDRTGIPSCTEAECDDIVTATFASEKSEESLRSS